MQTLRPQHAAAGVVEQHYTETYETAAPWPYAITLLAISLASPTDHRMNAVAAYAVRSQDPLTRDLIIDTYNMPYQLRELIEAETLDEIAPQPVRTFTEELGLTDNVQRAILKRQINQERDRRLAQNFMFQGAAFDFDLKSQTRIAGAATLAQFALIGGADVEDLYWHGGADPFSWITAENEIIAMTAPTCFAFGQAAAAHEAAHVFAARALKDMETIPADIIDGAHWPAIS
jgi:hypothetical protein